MSEKKISPAAFVESWEPGNSGRKCVTCNHPGVSEALDEILEAVRAGKGKPTISDVRKFLLGRFSDWNRSDSALRRCIANHRGGWPWDA